MNRIKLLITDMDNTLYDWFTPWYKSYKFFIDDVMKNVKDIKEEEFLSHIKEIHQKYGTSEYSFYFLIDELELVERYNYPEDKINELKYKFNKIKKEYLELYPSVIESLIQLKKEGCLLVAYTESKGFYASDRFRKLGLDGIFDKLYSPKEHIVPGDFEAYYEPDYYTLKKTEHVYLDLDHKKPDAEILERIVSSYGFKKEEVLYIGDSLSKDIVMAKAIGINDVHALYGNVHHTKEYELLRNVTHWTEEDVEREKELTKDGINPTYILSASFCEIFDYFEFSKRDDEEVEHLIKMWDRTIDVQKHFNELELKIRQLAISLSGILMGATITFSKFDKNIDDSSIISLGLFITTIIWLVFYFVDKIWYHPLLMGSVFEGMELEKKISKYIEITGLTHNIGKNSPITNKVQLKFLKNFPLYKVFAKEELRSNDKMDIFYLSITTILIFTMIISFFV